MAPPVVPVEWTPTAVAGLATSAHPELRELAEQVGLSSLSLSLSFFLCFSLSLIVCTVPPRDGHVGPHDRAHQPS